MTDPLSAVASLRALEDSDLAADLRRDLGAETLLFICAVEAALEVEFDAALFEDVQPDVVRFEETTQLEALLIDEAA